MHQCDDDIYASAPLRRLLTEQARVLAPELQRCFGTHGLLLGAFSSDAPPALPMLGCWTTLRVADGCYLGDLRAAVDEPLPFIDDAFDLVLLRHAQEVASNPSALLDEAARVLAPGGLLVLSGVHPLSTWSPWLHWRARGKPSQTLQMPLQLRHSLQQAGLEIERMHRVGGVWPGMTAPHLTLARMFGGGYVLIARKRRHMVTPLWIRQLPARAPLNGQLSPGTRRSSAL